MIETDPITFVITCSQSIFWALKARESSVKIARLVVKIFEYHINLVISHTKGEKKIVADYLSRIYMVPDDIIPSNVKTKTVVHIKSLFNLMGAVAKEVFGDDREEE